jgi:hypothetical protein
MTVIKDDIVKKYRSARFTPDRSRLKRLSDWALALLVRFSTSQNMAVASMIAVLIMLFLLSFSL